MAPYTILFVDDDEGIREVTAKLLSLNRMFVGQDGDEALRLLAQEHVDVLFTDRAMPGMNGIELAKLQRFPAKPNREGFDGVDDSVGAAGHPFITGRWCRAQFSNPGKPPRARSESRIRRCALLVCVALGMSESAGHWLGFWGTINGEALF
jgi:Response regulator receiver domain